MTNRRLTPPLTDDAHSLAFKVSLNKGDDEAFNLLFESYQGKIFNYINKIVKSKEVSEELVLDLFMKIYHAKEVLREVQNLDAFLYRMAVNIALDFLRAATKEKKLRALLAEQIETLRGEEADHRVIYNEYERELRLTIKQLPQQQQRIFKMSREEGLSHHQIAEDLKISKNTVKNHLVVALKRLRGIVKIYLFF